LVLITQVYHDTRSTECEIHKQAACYTPIYIQQIMKV